jgi:DNA polymerase zeta
MECLPLVMEPESAFYSDPVLVLDFQSLYPSMIIAYNLCYSTCLGKVFPSKSSVLGVSSYSADAQTIADLKNQLLLTPNGVLFVQPEVIIMFALGHCKFSCISPVFNTFPNDVRLSATS